MVLHTDKCDGEGQGDREARMGIEKDSKTDGNGGRSGADGDRRTQNVTGWDIKGQKRGRQGWSDSAGQSGRARLPNP